MAQSANDFGLGFRIVGNCNQVRRLVDAHAAMAGYASCDPRAEVQREGYLSAFQFDNQFRGHLATTGRTKGYAGPCWGRWLWIDIDRENDLESATRDARRLCATCIDRYGVDDDSLLIFFSGHKGFHIGLPTSLWAPLPSNEYHVWSRLFAEQLAATAGVTIDSGVYAEVQAFRAPNSRHPKTRLFKRRLEYNELLHVTPTGITKRSAEPGPFELPKGPPVCEIVVGDWARAVEATRQHAERRRQRQLDRAELPKLNRQTLEFIRHGATSGDRHRLLFSAAANLAEFCCPPTLAHALLTEAGLDCGLPPSEVRRQIDCGLSHLASTPVRPE